MGTADTCLYGYDAVGNLVQKQTSPETDGYFYDALDRLVQENRTATTTNTTGFAYDPNGNRISQTQASSTIPYIYLATSNRLLQVGTDTLMLDAAGNTVSDHQGKRTFTYGPAGRLIEVREGHKVAVYRYNAWGLRTEKRTEKGVTLYHYDQWGRLLSETSEDSMPRRDYVWGGALPMAQIDGRYGHAAPEADEEGHHLKNRQDRDEGFVGKERLTYLHTDQSGTPRLATNPQQAVVWRWEADAFGAGQPTPGNASVASVTINLRFPGQYFDAETRLHYNWNRYYNPGTGRYITSDPIGLRGGVNSYAYVKQNPIRYVDRTGLANVNPYDPLLNTGADYPDEYVPSDSKMSCMQTCNMLVGVGCGVAAGALAETVGGYIGTVAICRAAVAASCYSGCKEGAQQKACSAQ